jgi:hypothetical protein
VGVPVFVSDYAEVFAALREGKCVFELKTVLVIRLDAKNATCHWFWRKAGEKTIIFSFKIVVVITCHWFFVCVK